MSCCRRSGCRDPWERSRGADPLSTRSRLKRSEDAGAFVLPGSCFCLSAICVASGPELPAGHDLPAGKNPRPIRHTAPSDAGYREETYDHTRYIATVTGLCFDVFHGFAMSEKRPDQHSDGQLFDAPKLSRSYHRISYGDPDRIRTCNLPLRRGLLYPVEPRGHAGLFWPD